MAKIELAEGITLIGARRVLSKRGSSFRITRRHGKLYTIRKTDQKQPNSDKQKECREMLKRANVMAREDMAKDGRKEYWEKMARGKGYKTAIGCARAWYIAKIKSEDGTDATEKETEDITRRKAYRNTLAKTKHKSEQAENSASTRESRHEASRKKGRREDVIVIEKSWKRKRRSRLASHSYDFDAKALSLQT